MIILLWGKEKFRLLRKYREIKEAYERKNKGFNFREFDLGKDSFASLRDFLLQDDFFGDKKFAVIRNFVAHRKEIIANKDLFQKDAVVLFMTEELHSGFLSFFQKEGICQRFDPLSPREWASYFAAEYPSVSVDEIARICGDDPWKMKNALEQSSLSGDPPSSFVEKKAEADIFKTLDLLRQKEKMLRLLDDHLAKGDDLGYLFSMILYQIRLLLLASVGGLEKAEKKGFLEKKLKRSGFTKDELKKIYRRALATDFSMKMSGKPKETLRLFILRAF